MEKEIKITTEEKEISIKISEIDEIREAGSDIANLYLKDGAKFETNENFFDLTVKLDEASVKYNVIDENTGGKDVIIGNEENFDEDLFNDYEENENSELLVFLKIIETK